MFGDQTITFNRGLDSITIEILDTTTGSTTVIEVPTLSTRAAGAIKQGVTAMLKNCCFVLMAGILAALAQGMLAGLGYAVAGVKAPVLFGAITALLVMIPMGATLVWMPLGITLTLTDQLWPGIGLLLWGFWVVSTMDNVIRPIVISGASRVPFLIVLFGVLGGLTAFGMVGLFLGPVILSVLLSVWQAWLKQQRQDETMAENSVEEWGNSDQ